VRKSFVEFCTEKSSTSSWHFSVRKYFVYLKRLSNTVIYWTQASKFSTNLIWFILLFVCVLVPIHTNKYLLITIIINHLTQHLFTEICNQLYVVPLLGHPEALYYNYIKSEHTTVNVIILSFFSQQIYLHITVQYWGTWWRSWLRHCATSWKVAGSITDGVNGIFHWHNPSGHTMAPGVDSASNRNENQEYFLGG